MPGWRTKLTFAAVAVVGALLVAGCADTEHHTWQGEFTERLEGASAAIEEKAGELRPSSSETQVFRAGIELGWKLEFKRELVEELDPPAACEAVQEAGAKKLSGAAETTYNFGKNLTPTLHRRLPRILKEEIAAIGEIEHEAESCE
jgi:outer membrane murein-binding lipoprotein Lpp